MEIEKNIPKVSKVKCSRCGKSKFVNPQALIRRIAKYGSVEEIEKNWVCRECLDLDKEKQKKESENEKPKKTKKVEVDASTSTPEEIAKATIDVVAGEETKYVDENEEKLYSK